MVMRFLDSFDYYATSDTTRKWTSKDGAPTVQNTVVRNGINSLQANSTHAVNLTLDAQASWVYGFGFRITTLSVAQRLIEFKDGATVQCSLRINTNGTLEVRRGTSTAVTDGLSTFSINTNVWFYIEMKVTIADSIAASSCVVRVNEDVKITVATGQDLKVSANATADNFKMGNIAGGGTDYFDDIYICDGTGAVNNDFLGDVKVEVLLPDGNGTTNQFTGSDADSTDNYLHVDETDTDDDTSYVEHDTVGEIDLYTFDDISLGTPQTIHGLQINNIVKKDDAGSRTIRAVTRPVATNYFGGSKSPSDGSYSNERHVYDVSPETSVAWTESEINGTEFGIEIET